MILNTEVYSQNQILADSFEAIYLKGDYKKPDKIKILKELAVNQTDYEKKLRYSEELIEIGRALDSADYLFQGFLEKGNALRLKSDFNEALRSYLQAADIAEFKKNIVRLGSIYASIADVYSEMENYNNAVKYHRYAIGILRKENDSLTFASVLLNTGDDYFRAGKLDSALFYSKEALEIFKNINSLIGIAYSLGNIGMVFSKQGNYKGAEENINKADSILEKYEDYYPISVYLTYMSDIYKDKGNNEKALNYAERSLSLAKQYGLKQQISDGNLKLSEIYEGLGDYRKSFSFYKEHIAYRDSISNIKLVNEMADQRTNFEVSRKQIEVDLLNQQKRNQKIIGIATAIALVLVALLAIVLYRRNNFTKKTNRIIEEERKRSDSLLLNILPQETAQELKQSGKVLPQKLESVTVLFTDFKEFTHYAENLSPEKVVESIDFYFSKFDKIMEKYDLEKIKTVGDSYMCAGGLPFPTDDHAIKMVQAAFEIAEFVNDSKKINSENEIRFDIRIGINTGPVVAGVVGFKKFAYDIWGDTVNIASRMESNSEPGKINVSENTYTLIKDVFDCEYRGEIDVRNRGRMKMYFVNNCRVKI